MVQPQTQRVFFVADKTPALPRLERAPAQRGMRGGVLIRTGLPASPVSSTMVFSPS
jgi:hypothetical protein